MSTGKAPLRAGDQGIVDDRQPADDVAPSDPVELLRRWTDFGGTWTVVARAGDEATVSLRRCDGGEEQQRITCSDARFLLWLGNRSSSADL